VSPDYWRTFGITVRHGRGLETADRGRDVAVVSEAVARILWPGENPIGKRVTSCGGSRPASGLEVVGVAADVRADVEKEAPLTVYEPHWSATGTRVYFALRTAGHPLAAAGDLRRVLRSIDPNLPMMQAETMEQILDESVAARRFQLNLAIGFAVFALGLASLGIYGVISYAVARKTPELGIRLALGARTSALALMVIRQGMMPVLAGLAAGTVAALFVGRFIASQLYGVTARDPYTLAGVALLLTAVGICACWIPARRAMRINPLNAIRFE
jgi:putative ABC transport system permease protein